MLEIGTKVTWSIGKPDRPIVLKGLFIEETSKGLSRVLCYEQNGTPARTKVEVQTDFLQRI